MTLGIDSVSDLNSGPPFWKFVHIQARWRGARGDRHEKQDMRTP